MYDYEGVMHVWEGEKGCGFFPENVAVMEIYADDVTVKNFGFKGAVYGIRVIDEGVPRRAVRLENIEGEACFKGISLPDNFSGLWLKDVSVITWREDEPHE